MLGSKIVGGLLKDPKMASGQRALTAVGRGDPLLERQFNLIKLDSRYVLFFFTSKLLDSCYTVEKKQKYVGLPLRSFPFFWCFTIKEELELLFKLGKWVQWSHSRYKYTTFNKYTMVFISGWQEDWPGAIRHHQTSDDIGRGGAGANNLSSSAGQSYTRVRRGRICL